VHGVDNVGTVPAALTAYLAIQTLKPDLVISLGTAGGFKAKGGEIGDVYISTGFANHDRHIPIPVVFLAGCHNQQLALVQSEASSQWLGYCRALTNTVSGSTPPTLVRTFRRSLA
jgi:nucleoside phosphorylase